MIYTVTFNPALDYVIHMEQFIPGQVNRTEKEEIYFGGKGINVSTVLKNLGVESIALGFIAGFTGEALQADLQRKGISSRFLLLPCGLSRINVKIKGQSETEINAQGPDISQDALSRLFSQLDELSEGDFLVLAGSVPSSLPQDIYRQILARLENKGVMAVVDATRELLTEVLCYKPFLIKPNQHELGEIFHRELTTDEEITDCARKLQEQGARNVCISMAGAGSILLTEEGALHRMGVPKGTVKNSVGAGDSMVAGFLAGYLEKHDFTYALKMGTAAGSATAFSEGLAQKDKILELMAQL